jgi:hypothetical protein
MLISASANGEGGWITEVALAEKRPSSVVVRATQALAASDWAGGSYRLETHTVSEVENRLDELGIEIVILQDSPAARAFPAKEFPHQALVQQTVQVSPTWRLCASEAALSAYCRVLPPQVPRKPLEIDLRGRLGRVIVE